MVDDATAAVLISFVCGVASPGTPLSQAGPSHVERWATTWLADSINHNRGERWLHSRSGFAKPRLEIYPSAA